MERDRRPCSFPTLDHCSGVARKSLPKPDPPHPEPLPLASSIAALSLPGHRRSREWDDSDDNDPTGGVPDAYLPPSYWND